MKKVTVAMIGAGYINHYHARGLQAQRDVEIIVACDIDQNTVQKFAQQYRISETTTDALSLVDRDDIGAVILGVPNKFHTPYTIEFLENDKDVFIEKPMAINSQQGEQIAKAEEKSDRLVMVGHQWRFDVEANFVKSLIESDYIGKVVKTRGYGIHERWGPAGWFVQKELAGGGALADMGVHAIDTVRFLLGDPLPKQVYAKIGTYYGDYDVDDTGIIMISWDNGTTSIVESGWWQPHADGPEAATRLFGLKGYASLFPTLVKTDDKGKVHGEYKPALPERKEHCDQAMYTRQMAHFVECIRKRNTPIPGVKEGQVVVKIVDAAYQSAETGNAISL